MSPVKRWTFQDHDWGSSKLVEGFSVGDEGFFAGLDGIEFCE
jgi:hypothetical protein